MLKKIRGVSKLVDYVEVQDRDKAIFQLIRNSSRGSVCASDLRDYLGYVHVDRVRWRLRELVDGGFLKQFFHEGNVRTEYSLTEMSRDIGVVE